MPITFAQPQGALVTAAGAYGGYAQELAAAQHGVDLQAQLAMHTQGLDYGAAAQHEALATHADQAARQLHEQQQAHFLSREVSPEQVFAADAQMRLQQQHADLQGFLATRQMTQAALLHKQQLDLQVDRATQDYQTGVIDRDTYYAHVAQLREGIDPLETRMKLQKQQQLQEQTAALVQQRQTLAALNSTDEAHRAAAFEQRKVYDTDPATGQRRAVGWLDHKGDLQPIKAATAPGADHPTGITAPEYLKQYDQMRDRAQKIIDRDVKARTDPADRQALVDHWTPERIEETVGNDMERFHGLPRNLKAYYDLGRVAKAPPTRGTPPGGVTPGGTPGGGGQPVPPDIALGTDKPVPADSTPAPAAAIEARRKEVAAANPPFHAGERDTQTDQQRTQVGLWAKLIAKVDEVQDWTPAQKADHQRLLHEAVGLLSRYGSRDGMPPAARERYDGLKGLAAHIDGYVPPKKPLPTNIPVENAYYAFPGGPG